MSTKSISALTPSPIEEDITQNNEPALSDIPRRLSAGAAWLHGYINAPNKLDDDTPNTAPRSPMHGLAGHTHSGGIDGRAIFRSIVSISLDPNNIASSNLAENGHIGLITFTNRPLNTPPAFPQHDAGHIQKGPIGPPFPVWVPGCDPVNGAFQDLAIQITYEVKLNTNVVAGDSLEIQIENITEGSAPIVFTIAGPTSTGTARLASATSGLGGDTLPTLPGQHNLIQVFGKFTTDATASDRTLAVEVTEIELGVYST